MIQAIPAQARAMETVSRGPRADHITLLFLRAEFPLVQEITAILGEMKDDHTKVWDSQESGFIRICGQRLVFSLFEVLCLIKRS
ncbi:hypothetical protein GALMADRAFT_801148 [Galerina marginata CBS 339.88]|uniref:Uncharacterized protein n=1 Tax=Galerina marginata (strain CBS 339.88) TaxID=685588 RepID=A0A067SJA7_GALM3|nr:hypothetical protein GALMADRAFT_801148 [Galerina marginata CBS 339.88]